jgi:ATPase subunit of ABC transporter with duplicated ATPase domains
MTAQKKFPPPKPLPSIKDYGPHAIEVKDLTFAYSNSSALVSNNVKNVLQGLNLTLETGSRCLLIGANGRYVVDCFQPLKELSF